MSMPLSSSPTPARGISVALTTYNGQAHLEAQLDSISRQTCLPAELVVCDDVSTDGTIALLEAFAGRAPFPVRIHANPSQLGILNNFYRAFSLCSSPFIAYCDQDDVWTPDKLAKCRAAIQQPGVVLVSHCSRLTDSALQPLGISQPDGLEPGRYPFPHFPLRYWGFGHQMVFSRELLPLMNRLHSTVPADAVPILNLDELIPIAAGMVGDTVFISEPLMDFRRHSRATTFTVTTADNAPEVRSSVNLRLANKRLTLAKQCKALSTLRDWVTEQNLDAWGDAQHWSRYTAYLDRTLRAAEARLAVHQSADRFSQAKSLVTALTSRAYRDPRRGGAGRHQILIDLLAILKPARESAHGPQPDATRNIG